MSEVLDEISKEEIIKPQPKEQLAAFEELKEGEASLASQAARELQGLRQEIQKNGEVRSRVQNIEVTPPLPPAEPPSPQRVTEFTNHKQMQKYVEDMTEVGTIEAAAAIETLIRGVSGEELEKQRKN